MKSTSSVLAACAVMACVVAGLLLAVLPDRDDASGQAALQQTGSWDQAQVVYLGVPLAGPYTVRAKGGHVVINDQLVGSFLAPTDEAAILPDEQGPFSELAMELRANLRSASDALILSLRNTHSREEISLAVEQLLLQDPMVQTVMRRNSYVVSAVMTGSTIPDMYAVPSFEVLDRHSAHVPPDALTVRSIRIRRQVELERMLAKALERELLAKLPRGHLFVIAGTNHYKSFSPTEAETVRAEVLEAREMPFASDRAAALEAVFGNGLLTSQIVAKIGDE